MTPPDATSRVLVLGLDGATFDLIEPWLQAGDMPCLSRLYRSGVHGRLRSVIPPLSPEAWTTFMTGKDPGHHGVMNFLSFRPGAYDLRFTSGADRREPTLWRMLSDAGRRVGVVGVPMTYPPEQVNGYLVSGFETPGAQSHFTHPPELRDELRDAVGGYDLHGDFLGPHDPDAYLETVLRTVDNQAKAICYLLDRYPTDLSVAVIGATDRVQHYFWKFADPSHPRHDPSAPPALAQAVQRVYQRVDAAVEAILQRVPDPKTVVIVSDHGFGPCHKLVHLDQWLESRGYLVRSAASKGPFALAREAWLALRKYLPRWLKDWLKSALPTVRGQVQSFLLLSRIDWERTRAFALSTQFGYIHLHRRDRFPHGIVDPGPEADALCEAIARDLQDLRDPDTGEPVVEAVHRTRDLYPGPACDTLPDLIVLWRPGYLARTDTRGQAAPPADGFVTRSDLRAGDTGRLIAVEQSGCHTPEGILLAHGPGLRAGECIRGARLVDVAPTLLHLLGEPVPLDFAGNVLEQLFHPDFLAARPIRRCPPLGGPPLGRPHGPAPEQPYSADEEAELERRLRDLGYLD